MTTDVKELQPSNALWPNDDDDNYDDDKNNDDNDNDDDYDDDTDISNIIRNINWC